MTCTSYVTDWVAARVALPTLIVLVFAAITLFDSVVASYPLVAQDKTGLRQNSNELTFATAPAHKRSLEERNCLDQYPLFCPVETACIQEFPHTCCQVDESGQKSTCITEGNEVCDFRDMCVAELVPGGSGAATCLKDYERSGGIALHLFLLLYLFTALAIVCDDYFVPSLEKISKSLHLSSDVAGATFMAAGSSAPELFVSLSDNVLSRPPKSLGAGTIVGSAIFNILIIIGLSGLMAGQTLHLNWRPFARDSLFYIISILLLVAVFADEKVTWWEGLILLFFYGLYILFMYYNSRIFRAVDAYLIKHGYLNPTNLSRKQESSQTNTNTNTNVSLDNNNKNNEDNKNLEKSSKVFESDKIENDIESGALNKNNITKTEKDNRNEEVTEFAIKDEILNKFPSSKSFSERHKLWESKENVRHSLETSKPTSLVVKNLNIEALKKIRRTSESELLEFQKHNIRQKHKPSFPRDGSKRFISSEKFVGNPILLSKYRGGWKNLRKDSISSIEEDKRRNKVTLREVAQAIIRVNNAKKIWLAKVKKSRERSEHSKADGNGNNKLAKSETEEIELKAEDLLKTKNEIYLDRVVSKESLNKLPKEIFDTLSHQKEKKKNKYKTDDSSSESEAEILGPYFEVLFWPVLANPRAEIVLQLSQQQNDNAETTLIINNEQQQETFMTSNNNNKKNNLSKRRTKRRSYLVRAFSDWSVLYKARLWYILTFPINFLFRFTIPDSNYDIFHEDKAFETQNRRINFSFSFGLSVVWIALLSHLLTFSASKFGCLVGLDPTIMGLTVLAAGTSVPDALSSIVVSKDGRGDMAVANSIGSNVFDILIGLGLPYFIAGLAFLQSSEVSTGDLWVGVGFLFAVLIILVIILFVNTWKLRKRVGAILCFLYAIYVVFELIVHPRLL